jgi:hypothetical protein
MPMPSAVNTNSSTSSTMVRPAGPVAPPLPVSGKELAESVGVSFAPETVVGAGVVGSLGTVGSAGVVGSPGAVGSPGTVGSGMGIASSVGSGVAVAWEPCWVKQSTPGFAVELSDPTTPAAALPGGGEAVKLVAAKTNTPSLKSSSVKTRSNSISMNSSCASEVGGDGSKVPSAVVRQRRRRQRRTVARPGRPGHSRRSSRRRG